jgi:hypothetical protein
MAERTLSEFNRSLALYATYEVVKLFPIAVSQVEFQSKLRHPFLGKFFTDVLVWAQAGKNGFEKVDQTAIRKR